MVQRATLTLGVIVLILALSACGSETPAGATQTRSQDGMVMVYVPAGQFTMGSDEKFNEDPMHTVTLEGFWIDRTEVTNGQYRLCVEAGSCSVPSQSYSLRERTYYPDSQFDNYPVIYVDWNQAVAYCRWAGARLPTEAEWEKAARGTDGRKYPWGNQDPDCERANWNTRDGYCVGDTVEVGSYPSGASPYGALDMVGNVSEWVADWYDSDYYADSPRKNPKGPDSGDNRVLRGGSFTANWLEVAATSRHMQVPDIPSYDAGFRCAVSAEG